MGTPADRNEYSAFLEVQLERMTSAALNAASFQQRLAELERRMAETDENVLGSVRLARAVEAAVDGRERRAEQDGAGLAREVREMITLVRTQGDGLERAQRELDRLASDVGNLGAREAEARSRAALADRRLADEQSAHERTVGALRRQLDALEERLHTVERECARERRVAEERASVIEDAMTDMEQRIVGIVAGGVREAKAAAAAATAGAPRAVVVEGGGGSGEREARDIGTADGPVFDALELRLDALERALALAELRLDERIRANGALHAQRLGVLARVVEALAGADGAAYAVRGGGADAAPCATVGCSAPSELIPSAARASGRPASARARAPSAAAPPARLARAGAATERAGLARASASLSLRSGAAVRPRAPAPRAHGGAAAGAAARARARGAAPAVPAARGPPSPSDSPSGSAVRSPPLSAARARRAASASPRAREDAASRAAAASAELRSLLDELHGVPRA
ncbi:hypothetical protein KFE25_007899 [Diacronema lutheri]|uniref:Uncharacterized protein n=1 Tax=Diacronema lutheri TaxID=2081491 RepID=A0A8J6CE39_DIALT|nr:hypothetical protein KFE25_007899 [Diacronema lutheri]